jgi:hypothetical protein
VKNTTERGGLMIFTVGEAGGVFKGGASGGGGVVFVAGEGMMGEVHNGAISSLGKGGG